MSDYVDRWYGESDVIGRLRVNRAWAPGVMQPAFDYAIALAERAEAETRCYMDPRGYDKAYSDIVHYPKLCWLLAERPPEGTVS